MGKSHIHSISFFFLLPSTPLLPMNDAVGVAVRCDSSGFFSPIDEKPLYVYRLGRF